MKERRKGKNERSKEQEKRNKGRKERRSEGKERTKETKKERRKEEVPVRAQRNTARIELTAFDYKEARNEGKKQ